MTNASIIRILRNILCGVILLACTDVSAQFNIKVGYNGAYANSSKANQIIDGYNETLSSSSGKIRLSKFLHGLEFGGRYSVTESFRLDFGMSALNASNETEGVILSPSETITSDWKTSLTNYFVGVENQFGFFGYGANIGIQRLKYQNETSLNSEKKNVVSQSELNSRFYLNFESKSSNMSFAVRPYVSIAWQPYNVEVLELHLNPVQSAPTAEFKEDLVVYGLTLLFFNGPQ